MRLGPVVRKPLSANPGLKVNPSIHFLCIKVFTIDYVLRSLRIFKLKTEGKQYQQEPAPKSYKTEIQILANPGLA